MRGLGTIIFIVGIVATYKSVRMKTTVINPSSPQGTEEVYYPELLNEKTNHVIVSCFTMLIGAVWMASRKEKSAPPIKHTKNGDENGH